MLNKTDWDTILAALIIVLSALPPTVCSHGGDVNKAVSSSFPNPAAYTYTAAEVAHHKPGFFSCANLAGHILLGTYDAHNGGGGGMKCQLCELRGKTVRVLTSFHGESIYNIRPYQNKYVMLPVEQGALWRLDWPNTFSVVHPKHLRMGHYDFSWSGDDWITSEKNTITKTNKSQLWKNGNLLYQSSDFTWKEFVIKDGTAYIAAYFIWKRTEGGLLTVNLKTGIPSLVHSERRGACYAVGKYKNDVFYTIQFGKKTKVYKYPSRFIQEIPDIAWRLREIGGTFFMTAAEHGWRKAGPSYLYVFNPATKLFEKKLRIKDAEPWDICAGENENTYYLVTRNDKEGNLGRVYKIESAPPLRRRR
jgi:hypothetical protein